MSPEQTAVYLARFRDRIATIRKNVTVTSLKGRVKTTVRRRDSLGRRGENARLTLATSLGNHYRGVERSEEDLRDLSPVEDDWDGDGGEQGDGDVDGEHGADEEDDGDADWDGRSDSMEPLRPEEREDIIEGEEYEDGEWQDDREGYFVDGQWELDMDREEERYLDAEFLMAEEITPNGDVGSEAYVAYHSMNSRRMRKTRLEQVEKMYQSGGRYSTVGKKKGRELQTMLQNLSPEDWNEEAPNEETPRPATQEDETTLSSNPYPEDEELIPLTRQPARTHSLPTIRDTHNLTTISSGELSLPSSHYPSSAPTPFPQPPLPPTRSLQSTPRAITPSTVYSHFSIYPSNRTISPIAPFNTSRHHLSPVPSSSSTRRSYQPHLQDEQPQRANAYHDGVAEDYASNHPYHGMSAQETSEYWHALDSYTTESERDLRAGGRRRREISSPVEYRDRIFDSAGESYEDYGGGSGVGRDDGEARRRYLDNLSPEARRLAVALEMAGRGQEDHDEEEEFAMRTGVEDAAKKRNMVGRLLSTFTCRPEISTPGLATASVANGTDAASATMANTPRKYSMAYLSMKIGRTQRKEEEAKLRARLMAMQLPAPDDQQTQHIEDISSIISDPVHFPSPKERGRSPQRRPALGVANVQSQIQSVMGPPADLSRMIQRAPESIRTPTPLPESEDTGLSGDLEEGGGLEGLREEHSGSSLNNRLRQIQLEDLPLRSDAAQEIRDLMLALARNQGESSGTPTQPGPSNAATMPAGQADELPGGFSRPGNSTTTTTSTTPQPSLSARETLERHFSTQRQVNERYSRRVRTAASHSSSLTLPRSYRVPEMHSNVPEMPHVPDLEVQGRVVRVLGLEI